LVLTVFCLPQSGHLGQSHSCDCYVIFTCTECGALRHCGAELRVDELLAGEQTLCGLRCCSCCRVSASPAAPPLCTPPPAASPATSPSSRWSFLFSAVFEFYYILNLLLYNYKVLWFLESNPIYTVLHRVHFTQTRTLIFEISMLC
jgi:hypothetical protein